ncbi:hypothetical protein RUM44_003441 [Polyplax serrata]|uniref:Elongation of very long chain fatty acids protein n=1 Tax=Polyplax serrata TaxID=468196 RepID=A0ABR1AHW9_POLSC
MGLNSVVTQVVSRYNDIFTHADPRMQNYLLMSSPFPVFGLCFIYVYFVLHLGPKFMADRKPYNLRIVLVVYNALQTIFSAVMFYEVSAFWIEHYGFFRCIRVDSTSETPTSLKEIRLCHIYFLSKISELLDTIFFVLKKKNSHVSLLHVFHHAVMPCAVWVGVKFHPGGNLAFFGIPNLFVHIWMYFYYMMAAMGPQYQKYIWWKRHITQMQLVQFGMIMIYILVACIMCSQNRHLVTLTLVLDAAFVFLFLDFYRKAYRGKKGTKEMEIERVTDSSQIRKMNTGTGEKVLEMRNQMDTNGKVLGMRKRF